ncbi:hypothetical protein F5884DRAFT_757542 [Xylogone sp. PMI_703]|nr:hypothetical protein F5884DRAFT_757542 [Xylogone sp. PMI_703]
MASCLYMVLLLVAMTAGQTIQSSNLTSATKGSAPKSTLQIVNGPLSGQVNTITPLTKTVSLRASPPALALSALAIGSYTGTIKVADPWTTGNLTSLDIAYISCDPSIDQAILLYSLSEPTCNLTGYLYTTIYSMISASDSASLLKTIQSTVQLQANISAGGTITNDGGSGPVKAAAASILSTIAGIIVLLFMIIIAIGIVRACRNPERYGPRNSFPSSPRQSSAKGLTRAILGTLPIVQFSDPESSPPAIISAPFACTASSPVKPLSMEYQESSMGSSTQAELMHSQDTASIKGKLGCSICTEDFTAGADVRVLPCQHQFHPPCIDPWLLNMSGTCPLW